MTSRESGFVRLRSALLGVLLFAATANADVIGADDRRAPAEDEIELVRAMAHVVCTRFVDSVRRRSAGTGTLVGNRTTILTAAHIFTDSAGPRGPEVRFDVERDCVARQYDTEGNVIAEAAIRHAELGAYSRNRGVPNQDWAVLRTARPLSSSASALRFANGVSRFESLIGVAIRIPAFHLDVEDARRQPLISEGRLLATDYGGYLRLAHTADTGRMSSGAALVQKTDAGNYVVVGINRSSANLGEFNLAVPLSIELEQALRSYAYGQVPAHRSWLAASFPKMTFPAD